MDLGSCAMWKQRQPSKRCYQCNQYGHIARNCPGIQAKTNEKWGVQFRHPAEPASCTKNEPCAHSLQDEQRLREAPSQTTNEVSSGGAAWSVLPSAVVQKGAVSKETSERRGEAGTTPTSGSSSNRPLVGRVQTGSSEDERARSNGKPTQPPPYFRADKPRRETPRDLTCFRCGELGHFARNCSSTRFVSGEAIGRDLGYKVYEMTSSLPPYVDTHCHLEYLMERYSLGSYDKLVQRFCYPNNFAGCITSFCDNAAFSSLGCWEELLKFPGVWGAFGIHPHHSRHFSESVENKLLRCLQHPKCVALGEIGLDYSKKSMERSTPAEQKKVLKRLLSLAEPYDKPVVIHCNDAEDDLLDCLSSLPHSWRIHLHCYTGSLTMARKFLQVFPNLYIGFTGHLTFKKFGHSRLVAAEVPLNRLLIETDSPYMLPDQLAKQSKEYWSHPPMAVFVAIEIAQLRKVPVDELLHILRENTTNLYRI